jgi:hypothetical protein
MPRVCRGAGNDELWPEHAGRLVQLVVVHVPVLADVVGQGGKILGRRRYAPLVCIVPVREAACGTCAPL